MEEDEVEASLEVVHVDAGEGEAMNQGTLTMSSDRTEQTYSATTARSMGMSKPSAGSRKSLQTELKK